MAVAAPRARYREFLPRSVRIALGATGRTVSDRRLRHAVQHKVVLVTGASSGIGEATALRMGRAGATVLLLARREKLLQRVRDDIEHSGGQAFVYPCDLRDVDAVEKVAGQILDKHGHVDVIVNNAGHSIRRWISDSYDRFHDFERTIELNYLGPARLIMALLPTMRARHRGHIVNVATAGVNTPAPEWTAYVASKTAFETWLRGVAPEIRADGVTATTIYMQLVRTPMLGPFRVYKFIPGMSADEAAGLVARAVVERPRSIAPWWYRPGTALLWLVDDGAERVMALYPKLFNPASRPGPPLRPVIEAVGATALTADDAVGTATRLFETHVISGLRPDRLARALWNVQRSGVTAASLLTIQAARFPHRTAVIDERGRLSFPQLSQRVDALAAGLYARHHLGPGDRVGIMARNHRGFVEATFASLKLGADVVFLNTEFAGPQLADVLAREGANVAIYDEEFEAILEATGFAGVRLLAWHDGPTASRPTLDELAAEPAEPVRRSGIPGEIVLLTSGSTGTPKGAPRHTDVLRLARQAVPVATPVAIPSVRTALRMASNLTVPRSGDAIVVCPPLFHGFGLGGMLAGLALGSPIVLRRRFDAESTIAAIHRYQAGLLCAVPTMLKRILDLPEPVRARYDISSLRLIACGAAPLPPDLCTAVMDEFGDILINGYGSTEIGPGSFATAAELRSAPGTVGFPAPTTTIRILDDEGCELPTGSTGRIYIKNPLLFDGYSGGGTKETIDGFMRSGDVGHFDEKGRLFIDGRDDEMILSGGENVFPQEVEELLLTHDDVADAAVIGVPDDDFGQRLAAFVVRKPGATASDDTMRRFVEANLARHKVPRDVHFVDELPRTATGKLQRTRLTELTEEVTV